nr:S-layer homology domain-containing protein [Clostridiales bacterium]
VVAMTDNDILAGFPDGSFRPQGTLTREQAAKIVVYMLLGAEQAESLTCGEAPYTDVKATRWSAPYIAWCSDEAILHGYGNGVFGPEDTLTGMQFAKMLMCAFNESSKSRYTGSKWAESVQEDGTRLGLFKGDAGMCSHGQLQRQQAALMAFNAEQMPEDTGSVITPDDQFSSPADTLQEQNHPDDQSPDPTDTPQEQDPDPDSGGIDPNEGELDL